MAAATVNLPPIEKYASYNVPITLYSDFSGGTPIDLTSFTAADMMLRSSYTGSSVLELSMANGHITFPAPASGGMNLVLTPTITGALTAGTYIYDLLLTYSSGLVTRLIQGSVPVNDGVTHA